MPKVVINFNAKAAQHMCSKLTPTKVRIDSSWTKAKGLRLRPTTRKAGPHMLPALTMKTRGATLEIDDAVLGKMVEDGMPADFFQTGERMAVVEGTYDWVVLLHGENHEKMIGTASATVK